MNIPKLFPRSNKVFKCLKVISKPLTSVNKDDFERKKLELTLAIIKPHICQNPYLLQEIRSIILDEGFIFVRTLLTRLTDQQAQIFYAEHRGKFFYDRLVSSMTSGNCSIHVLARFDAINCWRQLMGPTKVFKTKIEHPKTIRARFGLTDTRNATHGSDSRETARREIKLFFPELDSSEWEQNEEPELKRLLTNKPLKAFNDSCFDETMWQHKFSITESNR